MKRISKRIISFVLASAIVFGISGTQIPLLKEIGSSMTMRVEAAGIASGNYGIRFSAQCGNNLWLYFSVSNENAKLASVVGCYSTDENTTCTIPEKVSWMGKEYTVS